MIGVKGKRTQLGSWVYYPKEIHLLPPSCLLLYPPQQFSAPLWPKKRDNNVILTIILSAEYAYLIIIINEKKTWLKCAEKINGFHTINNFFLQSWFKCGEMKLLRKLLFLIQMNLLWLLWVLRPKRHCKSIIFPTKQLTITLC